MKFDTKSYNNVQKDNKFIVGSFIERPHQDNIHVCKPIQILQKHMNAYNDI